MATINLVDDNVWDDSELVRSWNDALVEYKKYHSIEARGEQVEAVLKDSELKQLQEEQYSQRTGNAVASTAQNATGTVHQDITVGEENDAVDQPARRALAKDASQSPKEQHGVLRTQAGEATIPLVDGPPTAAPAPSMPQAVLGSGQDDHLKNLMISWYYAGYFQGIYEGQQKAAAGPSGGVPS